MSDGASDIVQPFIYVLVADEGTIESQSGGYILKIKKDDIDHVLEFSEKPFALKNHISVDRIADTWQRGAGEFAGATMKGVLLSAEGAIPSINIASIAKTEDEMQYAFSLDDNVSLDLGTFGKLKKLTTVNYCPPGKDGGGEWLWGN